MNDLSLRTRGYFKYLTNCSAHKREWTRAVLMLHKDPKNAIITADLQDTEYETLDLPDTKIIIPLNLFKVCRKHVISGHTSLSDECGHTVQQNSSNIVKNSVPCNQIHLSSRFFFGKKQLWLGFTSLFDQDIWYSALKTLVTKHRVKKNTLNGPDTVRASTLSLSQTSELDLLASALPNILDNEIYESTSAPDTFSVYIIHTEKSKDLGLSGRYLLRLRENAFELLDPDTYLIVKLWPIKFVRKFGVYTKRFYLITGSGCEDGRGLFIFLVDNADKFQSRLFRQMKQLTIQSQLSRRVTDSTKWIVEQEIKKESGEFHLNETNQCWFASEPRKKKNILTSLNSIDQLLTTKPRASSVNEFLLQKIESNDFHQKQGSSNVLPKEISVSLAYDSDAKSSSSSWIFPDENFIVTSGKFLVERSCQTAFDANTLEHSRHSSNINSPPLTLVKQRVQDKNMIHDNYGSQETFISETFCDHDENNVCLEKGEEEEEDNLSSTSQPVYANAEQISKTMLSTKLSANHTHNQKLMENPNNSGDETTVTSCLTDMNTPATTTTDASLASMSSTTSTLLHKPINTVCSYSKNWKLGHLIEPIIEREEQNSHNSSISMGNEECTTAYNEDCDGLVTSSTPDNDIDIKDLNSAFRNKSQVGELENINNNNKLDEEDGQLVKEYKNVLEDVKFYRLVSRSATWDGWMKLRTSTKQETTLQKVIVQADSNIDIDNTSDTITDRNNQNNKCQMKDNSNVIVMTAF
ncbi:Docking protein [Schistosoma japonicum]|uniref:Docking protein n=1 Tax=Schistosoma japonicum TaxID=6182 RepID=A0A4Z2DLM7_SCHJA|nr:Docking protein [Schistosoma japonicum]